MSVIQDSDDIVELYESVRDDNSDITWWVILAEIVNITIWHN